MAGSEWWGAAWSGAGSAQDRRSGYGSPGTGFTWSVNGRERSFWVTDTNQVMEIREYGSQRFDTHGVSAQKFAESVISKGTGRALTTEEISAKRSAAAAAAEARPNYEFNIGTPWGNKDNRVAARSYRKGRKVDREIIASARKAR